MSDPRRVLSEQSSGHTNANHWSLYYSYKRWCSLRHIIGDSNWAPVWQCHSRLMFSEGSHWSLWASLSSVSSDVWWQCVMWRSRGLSPDSDSEETRACAQHIGHSTVFRISHTHNYINEYDPNLYISRYHSKVKVQNQFPPFKLFPHTESFYLQIVCMNLIFCKLPYI